MDNKKEHITLSWKGGGKKVKPPMIYGEFRSKAVEISKLFRLSKIFAFDSGLFSTMTCKSAITYINGTKGVLMYRGYDIKDIIDGGGDFIDVIFLLIYGELPSKNEREETIVKLNSYKIDLVVYQKLLKLLPKDSHPMTMMMNLLARELSLDGECDVKNEVRLDEEIFKILAIIPQFAALIFLYTSGKDMKFDSEYAVGYGMNFMNMMLLGTKKSKVIMDMMLILQADHEQNLSTSTVRSCISSLTHPMAAVLSGMASLWGVLHGGANESVLDMLEMIGELKNVEEFVEKVKNKEVKLMGFGHRIYKHYDPRAAKLKELCATLKAKNTNKLLKIAYKLEEIALHDEYFKKRKLYPNVDFYSGIVYLYLGIPTKMFTLIFAMARTVGWLSHIKEFVSDSNMKILRPRQLYIGYRKRKFVPIDERN